MIRSLVAVSGLLVLAQLAHAADTDGKADEWIKYFAGKWHREGKIWTEADGWKEESDNWSCELGAGGKVHIAKGSGNWGDSLNLMGIDPVSGLLFEYGVAANGNRWRVEYTTVRADKLVGKLVGRLGDGTKGEGVTEAIRLGNDSYEVKWQFKMEDGKEMKGEAKNKRQ